MSLKAGLIISMFVILFSFSLTGCDVTAERELRRAEEAIEVARDLNSEEHATEDYLEAEELLIQASEMAKDNRIQEARQLAIKSKLRAEDATRKAKERQRILEAEMDELGR